MKFIATLILVAIISLFGLAQSKKSQKSKDSSSFSPHANGDYEKNQERRDTNHGHDKKESPEQGKEEAHEHDHEEGERRNVGPDKGVLEASDDLGFKLREGVEERFGIISQTMGSDNRGNIPKGAIVYSREEYQVFRKRNGFWKPVDIEAKRKGDAVSIKSQELKAGDLIATEGTGLLKIIELSVFGPAIEGHIH